MISPENRQHSSKNKVLLIVGMHRSGTSVVAQWIHRCGLDIGAEMLGPTIGNAEGHFEDLDFLHLHESILRQHNLQDEGLIDKLVGKITQNEKDQIKVLIGQKDKLDRDWGWKEPRTCLFLDSYRDLLPQARYLIVIRGYQSVVSSLIMRIYRRTERKYAKKGGLSRFVWEHFKKNRRKKTLLRKYAKSYLKTWTNYNHQILALVNGLSPDKYHFVQQDVLLADSGTSFRWLQDHCGFSELKYIGFDKVYKESLQSDVLDVDAYIHKGELLVAAKALEVKLESMLNND